MYIFLHEKNARSWCIYSEIAITLPSKIHITCIPGYSEIYSHKSQVTSNQSQTNHYQAI
jgi:hypothetical protein